MKTLFKADKRIALPAIPILFLMLLGVFGCGSEDLSTVDLNNPVFEEAWNVIDEAELYEVDASIVRSAKSHIKELEDGLKLFYLDSGIPRDSYTEDEVTYVIEQLREQIEIREAEFNKSGAQITLRQAQRNMELAEQVFLNEYGRDYEVYAVFESFTNPEQMVVEAEEKGSVKWPEDTIYAFIIKEEDGFKITGFGTNPVFPEMAEDLRSDSDVYRRLSPKATGVSMAFEYLEHRHSNRGIEGIRISVDDESGHITAFVELTDLPHMIALRLEKLSEDSYRIEASYAYI